VALPTSVFTQRQIFIFWMPLAASWLLMGAEGPILQAIIARLGDMQTQLAAFGIVFSLEIAIESPVIMLLATSTALATSASNYRTLRLFMIWVNVLCTIVAILMAFTPLYGLIVRHLMGIPQEIADAAQPGMKIMTFWTAAIGVRRFLQGVLIRYGRTNSIGYGTVLRLLSSAGTGLAMALLTRLPGVYIGSMSLMVGVLTETIFIMWAARPTVAQILSNDEGEDRESLTLWAVTRFHTPLAATSLLSLMAQPLVGAGLARMPYPEENLAAWPLVWGIQFLFRSPSFALPETVIALINERRLRRAVWKFCWRVGIGSTVAMTILVITPLADLYLRYVAGLTPLLTGFVIPGLLLSLAFPMIHSFHSWYRGVLMAVGMTGAIYWGMGINLVVTCLLILLGVALGTPGTPTAVVVLTIALLAELYYLHRARAEDKLP